MTLMSAERLVSLYPATWRERYGDGLTCLLEDEGLTARVIADTLFGAADAQLRAATAHGGSMHRFAHYLGRSGLSALYLLLTFPLGIAYFVFLVTGIAVGVSLSITWIGIPILVGTMLIWWQLARMERLLTAWMLDARIPVIRTVAWNEAGRPRSVAAAWSMLKQQVQHPTTWKSLAYLLAEFPFGILSFVVLVFFGAFGGTLLAMPLLYRSFSEDAVVMNMTIDRWYEAALCSVAGLVILAIALPVVNGLAAMWRKVAETLLTTRTTDTVPHANTPGAGSELPLASA